MKIRNIKEIFLVIRWKDLIFFIYTYIIYVVIKLPINCFIYESIDCYLIAFLLALIISFLITKITRKFFRDIFKYTKYDKILNLCIVDSLRIFCYYIAYRFNVVYYHGPNACFSSNPWGTLPDPSDTMKRQMGERFRYLIKRRNICIRTINKLEPLASAMEREKSHPIHGGWADAFGEQFREAKSELNQMEDKPLYSPFSYIIYSPYSNISGDRRRELDEFSPYSCISGYRRRELDELYAISLWTKWF